MSELADFFETNRRWIEKWCNQKNTEPIPCAYARALRRIALQERRQHESE